MLSSYHLKYLPSFFYENSDFWKWTVYPSFAAYPIALWFYVIYRKRKLKDTPNHEHKMESTAHRSVTTVANQPTADTVQSSSGISGSVREQLLQEARRRAGNPLQPRADSPASQSATKISDQTTPVEAAAHTASRAVEGKRTSGTQAIPSSYQTKPKQPILRFAIITGSVAFLATAIYGGIELSKRHTLTPAERAQAEGWFADLRNQQWVLVSSTDASGKEYVLTVQPTQVSADNYGKTTIHINVELLPTTSGTRSHYGAVEARPYTDLSEPAEIFMADDNDVPGEGSSIMLRRITRDSIVVEFRSEDGVGDILSGIPEEHFSALQTARESARKRSLIQALDSIAQGVGMVRKGTFMAYACGDECGAVFIEQRNGQAQQVTYVCNTNRFGDTQLSQGDMLGEGDFTNRALQGHEFLIVSKMVIIPGQEEVPAWAIQGMLPYGHELASSDLDERLAVSANFDAASGVLPVGASVPVSWAGADILNAADLDVKPQFPGGEAAFYRYLESTVNYPELEREQGVQGKVFVEFTVDRNGFIQDVKAVRPISEGLDREAVRVIRSMPRWMPGTKGGEPVNCRYALGVNFRLS